MNGLCASASSAPRQVRCRLAGCRERALLCHVQARSRNLVPRHGLPRDRSNPARALTYSPTMSDHTTAPDPAPAPVPDTDAALLRAYLATHDERCPSCDYNLRALRTSHCPECGSTLTLKVAIDGSSKSMDHLWALGYLGLATGAGAPLSFVLLLLCAALYKGSSVINRPMFFDVLGLSSLLLMLSLVLWLWWAGRKRILRLTSWQRAACVLGCWAGFVGSVASTVWIISHW